MIIEAATAAAVFVAERITIADASNVPALYPITPYSTCSSYTSNEDIKTCIEQKMLLLRRDDHEEMWDPDWISSVEPTDPPRTVVNKIRKKP